MFKTIQTAYKFLRFDKSKSIGIIIAVMICSFLIGDNLGVFMSLSNNMSSIIEESQSDLWVTSQGAIEVNQLAKMDKRTVSEVASVPGVEKVSSILITGGKAVFSNGFSANVLVIGSDAPSFMGGPSQGKIDQGTLDDLLENSAVSADIYDNNFFRQNIVLGNWFEINGKKAKLAVITKGVRAFSIIVYTTLERARYYGNHSQNDISAVLVKIKNGNNHDSVVNFINKQITGAKAWKKEDFINATVSENMTNTGIGVSTTLPIVITIASAFFIIGLTIYSMTLDRIKDYGILKAIGATNRFIRQLIFTQATMLAIIGFLISYPFLELFRMGLSKKGLIFHFSSTIYLEIFLVCIIISISGSLFALRRINGIEPASVFRN